LTETATAEAYFDPAALRGFAENIDPTQVVETDDFQDSAVIPVATYTSPSREIKRVDRKDDGNVTIELHFTTGLHADSGRVYGDGRFPQRTWISSKLFALPDRPGKTSSLAQYLKACGFETKGKTLPEMLDAVAESLTNPVNVFVGRTDKAVQQADGSYKSDNLKTKDFVNGTNEDGSPSYGVTATKNGKTYTAKAKIQGFRAIE
jgi:hypothetical protein